MSDLNQEKQLEHEITKYLKRKKKDKKTNNAPILIEYLRWCEI